MIPKLVHFIHFGVPADRELEEQLRSFDYEVRWWNESNTDFFTLSEKIQSFLERGVPAGAADLARYEILARFGGIYLDTDFRILREFPDWLHECEAFAAYENDVISPGLLANGFLGARPENQFMSTLVSELLVEDLRDILTHEQAVKKTGPFFLTRIWRETNYLDLTTLPYHFVYPVHWDRRYSYTGRGPVYANHLWQSLR